MLSDALRELHQRVRTHGLPEDTAGLLLSLRAFEIEARNLEERIEIASGRPHVALDGMLIAAPTIQIGGLSR
ncbi:hypothetical protein SAMN05880590_10120 [Rhizobium sp. RU35A]|uniref:hypothetical protein n=1 Tax=Rhizobium sp. RU35A TaxID=1907414 RepID=UPI000953B5C5|nr:hypothetical protein [Rhizobium sp. RU35A]SIP89049.1 hypothetical protein SAMN05880590_10120 [Rhizobium sp. RU35A]